MGGRMTRQKQEREREENKERIAAEVPEPSNEQVVPYVLSDGRVVKERHKNDYKITPFTSSENQMVGFSNPDDIYSDTAIAATDAMAAFGASILIAYTDYSGWFNGEFSPKQTVHDILTIMVRITKKRFCHICDSETGNMIHEDTELSTLLKENRLNKLRAITDFGKVGELRISKTNLGYALPPPPPIKSESGAERPTGKSANMIQSKESIPMIGGGNPDGHKYSTDDHAVATTSSELGTIIGRVEGAEATIALHDGVTDSDEQKQAIDAQAAKKVRVMVEFSDDTVANMSNILNKRSTHTCDSTSLSVTDEDTDLWNLERKNRLAKLDAITDCEKGGGLRPPKKTLGYTRPPLTPRKSKSGAERPIEMSANVIPSKESIPMIGGGNPDEHKYSTNDYAAQKGYPYHEVSAYVGYEGKTITIGGCSVIFPLGCFEKTKKVTVSVCRNLDTWPRGKVGITPALHVKTHDLKVPAIVKMKTWCVDDEDIGNIPVEVLRFDGYAKHEAIFHLCQLTLSREIEFRISHSSDVTAFIGKDWLPSVSYALHPIVCFDKHLFAITTALDDELSKEDCMEFIKGKIGKDLTVHSYNTFHCKYSTPIICKILPEQHESDFTFKPSVFVHIFDRNYRGSFTSFSVLDSKREQTSVTLRFQVFKEQKRLENQAFKYVWRPEYRMQPTSEQTKSNFDGTPASTFHVGGDMHPHVDSRKTIDVVDHRQITSHKEDGLTIYSGEKSGESIGTHNKGIVTETNDGQLQIMTRNEHGSGNTIVTEIEKSGVLNEHSRHVTPMIGSIDDDVTKNAIDVDAGFPYDEVSEYVGSEGKTINIGECSVTFPPGCFEKTQRVTVSVSINPDKWPNGKVGITPTLHVKAQYLKVPAIVKMKTWCVDDDNEDLFVEVLRFDEDEKDWNIAHSCPLGQSRDIEFQVSHFSKFLAFLKKLFLPSYAVRTIVCFHNDQFAIATVLDDKTAEQYCITKLKNRIDKDATINPYDPFHCKYSTSLRSRIFSKHHESDFTFTPIEVEHTVQRVYQARGSLTSYLILESKREPTWVTLSLHVFANKTRMENQAFKYFWRPVEQRLTSEEPASNCPGNSAGNIHVGRDMPRDGAAIGSQVMGQLDEKNRDHLKIFASHEGGSRGVIRRFVGPNGKMTQDNERGTNLEGNIPPDVMKHAIDAQTGNKVEVAVKFSDFAAKHVGKYRLNQTVYDIIADIKHRRNVDVIYDSETREVIHVDTKIFTLQEENRLVKLTANVVEQ